MPTTKDLLNNSTVKALLCCKTRVPDATSTGAAIDLKGIGRKVLVILDACQCATSTTISVIIQEDDTDGFTTPTTLYDFTTLDIVAGTATLVVADMAPNERYIRAVSTGGAYTLSFSVIGVIYLERERPSGI